MDSLLASSDCTRRLLRAFLLLSGLFVAGCGGDTAESAGVRETDAAGGGLVVTNPSSERPYFHDFGTVDFGKQVRHTFELENRDPQPMTIYSVQGGCSCTRILSVDHVRDGEVVQKGRIRSGEDVLILPPGEVAHFTVSMDTGALRSASNEKLEIVRMRTSSPVTSFPTFELHIKTVQPFQITPPTLNLGEIPHSAGASGVVRIVTQVHGGSARILDVVEAGEGLEVTLDETFVGGEFMWNVTVRAHELLPKGVFRSSFTLSATGIDGEGDDGRHHIEVWAQVVDDVVASPRMFTFRPVAPNERYTLRGRLRALVPGATVKVLSHTVEGPLAEYVAVDYAPLAPNAKGESPEWSLELTTLPGLPQGRFVGTLRLELDDPQTPEVLVPFNGVVQP